MQPHLIDTNATFGENADGLFIHHKQELTADFLDSLDSERFAKAHLRSQELDRVASIPTFVVELWMRRDGFSVYDAPARDIVKKLQRENLDAFITTPKAV